MSTTVLLIVLAACAAAVLGGLTYFGLRAYRLFRTGAPRAAARLLPARPPCSTRWRASA
jgi:hypothetical protein